MASSIINSDDGSVSGTTGLKTTGGDDGELAFESSGTEAMRIDSSGNVGVGTSSPSEKLHILDSGNDDNGIRIQNADTGSSAVANVKVFADAAQGGLAVTSSSYTSGNVIAADCAYLYASSTSSNGLRLNAEAAAPMVFGTSNTERMRIDSSGNVGIGTSSPSANLHISGGPNQVFKLQNTAESTFTATAGGSVSLASTSNMVFQTGGTTERMRIDSSGNLLVGTTTSNYLGHTASNSFNTASAQGHAVALTGGTTSFSETGGGVFPIGVVRSATSGYVFAGFYSGNGTGAFADKEFSFRGDGNGYADGTFNNNGADYAEFFESANGQALTLGATVVLDGNKVREATEQDPASAVIGVVRPKEPSKASMVVGNTAWNKWANKYLTDDFDRFIMEDHDVVEWEETITDEEGKTSIKQHSYESHNIPENIIVPQDATVKTHDDNGNKFQHYKLNPAWDKDSEYMPREQRPEWNIIGLLGQVKILKGQPVGDRWVKMRDVSETVEEWFIR